MSGIYVEKVVRDGEEIWAVRDIETRQVVAFGASVVDAIQNYDVVLENKRMVKKIGINDEDMEF